MHSSELLNELVSKIRSGEITHGEVINRINLVPTQGGEQADNIQKERREENVINGRDSDKSSSHFSVVNLLYTLGAVIVIIGLSFFIAQIWSDISSILRVMITLGLGLLLTGIGLVLAISKPKDKIGIIFQIIGGVLIPGGAIVTLNEFSNVESMWALVWTFGAIFLFYLIINLFYKSIALTFFTIAHATIFVYLAMSAMMEDSFYSLYEVFNYLTMVIGISYILLAYSFKNSLNENLSHILYLVGSVGFLGSTFSRVFDSTPWLLAYFPLVVIGIVLSVYIRSRGVLFASTAFLIIYISYITSRYFADSVGWPVSLVVLGFVFIGLGYGYVSLSRKYISGKKKDSPVV